MELKLYDKYFMLCQFSYHTPYQPQVVVLALGLIWVFYGDFGCDIKISIQ